MTQIIRPLKNSGADAESPQGRPGRKFGSPSSGSKKLVTHGAWWWALPAIVAVLCVHYIATFIGGAFAFTNYAGYGEFDWTGLDNFNALWADPAVSGSILNTLFLAFGSMIAGNLLGLLLALALNRGLKTRYLLRTILFFPVVLSSVAVSFIFNYIFTYDGPLDTILDNLGLSQFKILWLADPTWSIWLILLVVVWQSVPFAMVIFLAGLATVPQELEEAASIDGAGTFKRFFSVTVPLIQPSLAISTTLALVQGLKIFDQVLAMTNGGPYGSTDTLSTVIYRSTFQFMQFGYGSAIALIFTVFILIAAAIQLWLTRDRAGVNK